MNIERFAAILDAYGADARRWPAGERSAALALAERDPRAAGLLAEAADLDHVLGLHRIRAPSAAVRERVLEAAPRGGFGGAFAGMGRFWAPSAGLAAAGIAGLLVGAGLFSNDVSDTRAQALLAEAQAYDAALMLAGESEAL